MASLCCVWRLWASVRTYITETPDDLMISCDDCVLVTCEIFPPGLIPQLGACLSLAWFMHRFMICTFWARYQPSGWCDWLVTAQTVCSAGPAVLQSANQGAASLTADQSQAEAHRLMRGLRLCNNPAQSRLRDRGGTYHLTSEADFSVNSFTCISLPSCALKKRL